MRASFALAGAAALAIGAAALAQQQEAPESLLPPGFGDPVTATPTPAPVIGGPRPPSAAPVTSTTPDPSPSPSPSPTPIDPAELARYEMPEFARRSLDLVGVAGPAENALDEDAFGAADGRYLEALMRRASVPIPSRWLSIALRRALVSRVSTPSGVNGADFAAERAWLLIRMGESVAARAVVQSVDAMNATPKLRQIAMQAGLATADPGALCPFADTATDPSNERGWVLARAMCAALGGDQAESRALMAAAKRRRVADGIDLKLAEKVAGAGADSRQAVTIEWEPVGQLTAWRFGLATATGVAIPETLYETVGPQVAGWRAQAPSIPIEARAGSAERAAAMGVLSNAALVDFYAAADASEDSPAALSSVASDLRAAYAGADLASRRDALKTLWGKAASDPASYSRLVLTARAAARVPASADFPDPNRLVAAMLSAGLDRSSQRWRLVVPKGDDAWAMLLLADPDFAGRVAYGDLAGYAGTGNAARKQRLFFAGLAGLGRLSPEVVERGAKSLEVRIGKENAWTRAIDRAAAERQPGTVLLLAAMGMQTDGWAGVPPEALYRITGALRAVGLSGYARMIAAEAIARS